MPTLYHMGSLCPRSLCPGGLCQGDPLEGTWDERQRPPGRNMRPGNQTRSDIQRPLM